jgi:cysteine-rich repeat protein
MRGGWGRGRALAGVLAGVWATSGCSGGGEIVTSGDSLDQTEPAATTTGEPPPPDPDTSTGTSEGSGSMLTMAPTCGDGSLDAAEECDDGNLENTDECTNACKLATCGDSFVQAGEDCDDGNLEDTDECPGTCVAPACGDSFVQDGVEACDDGNLEDGDDCSSLCTLPGCGDGVVDPATEECDDSNAVNTDECTAACKFAFCGDGILQDGAEECDDNNADPGDGCEPDCLITQKFTAQGPQINFPEASLTGWTVCFSGTYDQAVPPVADVLVQCNKANLMLACRPVGNPNFTVLAHAPREPVTTINAELNTPTVDNGVGWYFSDSISWGFAIAGDPINRNSCDVETANPDFRMCWHTSAGSIASGYSCGANLGLGADATWERVVLHAD